MIDHLKTDIPEILSDIQSIATNTPLLEVQNFNARATAIDFLDFHIIERIAILLEGSENLHNLLQLKQQAAMLKSNLENIDANLFKQLRSGISRGVYRGGSFTDMIAKYCSNDTSKIGYDDLDVFINGLLSDQHLPEPPIQLDTEMVFYQKTPARIIFELVRSGKFKHKDVFFDLGSGLGQVTILVNLLSGVTAKGVEYDPTYCNYAKTCAQQLNLCHVEFINNNALNADYSEATVFFMYTPFIGSMLQKMLGIMQKEALKRSIRIFTYGPCSPIVAQQSWLICTNGNAGDVYKLYEFKS